MIISKNKNCGFEINQITLEFQTECTSRGNLIYKLNWEKISLVKLAEFKLHENENKKLLFLRSRSIIN